MAARLPIVKDMLVTHLQTISVEQFDDLRSRPIIKNDIKLRINSLFPNKPLWEDTAPVRKILFSEFYRQ
jgi:flagellar basal body-associated protein FliL